MLDLSGNALSSLQPGVFQPLKNLQILYFNCRGVIVGGEQGSHKISCNRLKRLQSGALRGLRNLELLDLSGVGLTSMESKSFSELESLTTLYLGCTNGYETFGADDGINLQPSITVLRCNQLGSLSEDVFQGLTKLKELDLSGNLIVEFHPFTYVATPALEVLWLANNTLNTLNFNETFRPSSSMVLPFQSLQHLDLSLNEVRLLDEQDKNFHELPFQLPKLEILEIQFNPITLLPEGQAGLQGIGVIVCAVCRSLESDASAETVGI